MRLIHFKPRLQRLFRKREDSFHILTSTVTTKEGMKIEFIHILPIVVVSRGRLWERSYFFIVLSYTELETVITVCIHLLGG